MLSVHGSTVTLQTFILATSRRGGKTFGACIVKPPKAGVGALATVFPPALDREY
jgi:hypothetical protein